MSLPTLNKLWKLSFFVCLLVGSSAKWGGAQSSMSRGATDERIAVSSDLQMIYEKTETASSVADYTSIYDFCRNVLGDKTRNNDDRQYARTLMSWAANRRGEARSDQAGMMVRSQQLDEAAQMDALAVKDFETAIQLDNTRWRAHHNLAIVRAVQGKHEEALESLDKVIALNPDFSDAYFNRGEVFFRTSQWESAVNDYNKVISLKPEDPTAYSSRAHCFYAMGKTNEALDDYAKAMELSPHSSDAITEYADTCQALGKWKEAAIAYQQAMHIDSQNARTLQNAAWMMATCPDEFYRNGKTALSTAQKAVQVASAPGSAQVLDVLAAAQAAAGDFASAQSTVAEALRSTTDPVLRNELVMRGKLYARKRIYVQPKN